MILWDDATETPVQPVPVCALCDALAAPAFAWPLCAEPVRVPGVRPIPFHHHTARVCAACARTLGVER